MNSYYFVLGIESSAQIFRWFYFWEDFHSRGADNEDIHHTSITETKHVSISVTKMSIKTMQKIIPRFTQIHKEAQKQSES